MRVERYQRARELAEVLLFRHLSQLAPQPVDEHRQLLAQRQGILRLIAVVIAHDDLAVHIGLLWPGHRPAAMARSKSLKTPSGSAFGLLRTSRRVVALCESA